MSGSKLNGPQLDLVSQVCRIEVSSGVETDFPVQIILSFVLWEIHRDIDLRKALVQDIDVHRFSPIEDEPTIIIGTLFE